MNAVKRCLALIAATVFVGACSGDPTADLAGANLSIRATPGVIWMLQNKTQTVLLEAIDGTGAPAPGSWTATTTGPVVATLDTSFEHTSSGSVGQGRQFIISATAEGNGTVTFTGSGGTKTIPVRVSPDPVAFHATPSNLNPGLAEVITLPAPAGLRYTAGTTVNFVTTKLNTVNDGLAAPSIVSMTADSASMDILPAPGAAGRLLVTGIASTATPTLTTSASTVDSVTVPPLLAVPATWSNAAPAINAGVTLTAGTNFKLRPTSIPSSGNIKYFVLSRSADSTSMDVIPTAGTAGPASVTNIQFIPLASLALTLPTSTNITVPAATNLGADDFFAGGGAAALGAINVPATVGVPNTAATFDVGGFTAPDNLGDGGPGEQDYRIHFTNAGTYDIRLTWNTGADVDLSIVDATYSNFINGSFNGAGKDELVTYTAAAGEDDIIVISQFAGTAPSLLRVTVTRTN